MLFEPYVRFVFLSKYGGVATYWEIAAHSSLVRVTEWLPIGK